MKAILVALSLVCAEAFAGGFVLREENDVFYRSDRRYTQGLELLYRGNSHYDGETAFVRNFGIRNLIYTPDDITISDPQLDGHPWAGMTCAVVEDWSVSSRSARRLEWVVGVAGDISRSDDIQAWFHDRVGSREPMGWDNQIPSEPVLNATLECFRAFAFAGRRERWGADATAIYGGSFGTAFINAEAGTLFRAGWNIPNDYSPTVIAPTFRRDRLYAYVLAEQKGRLVLHNVTLGGSLFQDGPSQDLERCVADFRFGPVIGWKDAFGSGWNGSLSYSLVRRTQEFEKQEDPVTFGSVEISLTVGR